VMSLRDTIVSARNEILRKNTGLQCAIKTGASRRIIPPFAWKRLQPYGEWELSAPDGTKFIYSSSRDDGVGRAIIWTDMRDWERGTQKLLFTLARNTEYFVDIGAYSGIYCILACIANPTLKSIAFEPNPAASEKLRRNIAINGLTDRVTLVDKALSVSSGHASLAIPRDVTAASLNAAGPKDRTIAVTVTTGDDVLGDLPVGLIKIDVEGLEPEVLLGMTGVLANTRPAIIAECLGQAALNRLRSTTSHLGYNFTYQIRTDRPVLIDNRYVHKERGGGHNYLFTAHPLGDLI